MFPMFHIPFVGSPLELAAITVFYLVSGFILFIIMFVAHVMVWDRENFKKADAMSFLDLKSYTVLTLITIGIIDLCWMGIII